MPIALTLNGEERVSNHSPLTPLVDVLRDEFFLKGAKTVCREGFCGSCTVMVDGRAVVSCLLPLGHVEGADVETVESLASDGVLCAVQKAMVEHDAVQCGMCFPGMVMSLVAFFDDLHKTNGAPKPASADVKAALCGNICRCTGYERIVTAALSVSDGIHAQRNEEQS